MGKGRGHFLADNNDASFASREEHIECDFACCFPITEVRSKPRHVDYYSVSLSQETGCSIATLLYNSNQEQSG